MRAFLTAIAAVLSFALLPVSISEAAAWRNSALGISASIDPFARPYIPRGQKSEAASKPKTKASRKRTTTKRRTVRKRKATRTAKLRTRRTRQRRVRQKRARRGHSLRGLASYYWQPQRVASGGWFNPNALTAAHKTLPFGTRVKVTNLRNGRSVVVRINDRGPYIRGRIIDLSRRAAGVVGMQRAGVVPVRVQIQ